jgi:hypothetical protein
MSHISIADLELQLISTDLVIRQGIEDGNILEIMKSKKKQLVHMQIVFSLIQSH